MFVTTLTEMYMRGWSDSAIAFSYIPDFKNGDEKLAYTLGYRHGMSIERKNPLDDIDHVERLIADALVASANAQNLKANNSNDV